MTKPLRSARWFNADDLRGFGHRSRLMQMGYGLEGCDFDFLETGFGLRQGLAQCRANPISFDYRRQRHDRNRSRIADWRRVPHRDAA